MFKNSRYSDEVGEKKEDLEIILEDNIKILEGLVNCPVTIIYKNSQYGNKMPIEINELVKDKEILDNFQWHGCMGYKITDGAILFWNQQSKLRSRSKILESAARQIDLVIKNSILTDELRKLSITDGLTGLNNRRYFMDELQKLLEYAKRENKIIALCIIDIDKFKSYNDTFGHPRGDKLLIELSKLLRESVRSIDITGRLGGEEFGIILNSVDSIGNVKYTADRVRGLVEDNLNTNTGRADRQVTVSIGVATNKESGNIADELYKLADSRLYKAKNSGRNKTVVN